MHEHESTLIYKKVKNSTQDHLSKFDPKSQKSLCNIPLI